MKAAIPFRKLARGKPLDGRTQGSRFVKFTGLAATSMFHTASVDWTLQSRKSHCISTVDSPLEYKEDLWSAIARGSR